MDIIVKISDYLTANASLDGTPIVSPVLTADSKSIAIRETPSSIDTRYLSTDKTLSFQFQILVKSRSILSARSIINSIFEKLDGIQRGSIVSDDNSFVMTSCECTTLPNWVETTEHNEHIFTALFNSLLEKGGN